MVVIKCEKHCAKETKALHLQGLFYGWTRGSASPGCLDSGYVDLAHLHHGLERAPGDGGIWVGQGLGEGEGGDLPGEAPLVLAPAAFARLTAVVYDGVPVAIRLGLGLGRYLEREGPAVVDPGATVEPEAGDPHQDELDRQQVPLFAGGKVGGGIK